MCDLSVVVRTDAELDESSVDDVAQCEIKIVIRSRALLSPGDEAEIQRGANELYDIVHRIYPQTSLAVIRKINSLALYLTCLTSSALSGLRDQWSSGQLKDIFESLFTYLSGAKRTVRVKRLNWPLPDYERCVEFFIPVKG